MNPLVMALILFLVLMFLGMPIVFVMCVSSLSYCVFSGNYVYLMVIIEKMFRGMDSFVLLAIPMFIMCGEVMNRYHGFCAVGHRLAGLHPDPFHGKTGLYQGLRLRGHRRDGHPGSSDPAVHSGCPCGLRDRSLHRRPLLGRRGAGRHDRRSRRRDHLHRGLPA